MPRTREELIESFMRDSGMTRAEAEFAAAVELGEIPGDVIDLDEEDAADDGTDG